MTAVSPTPEGMDEIAYLAWALPRYGRVRFDLASSGAPPAPGDLVTALAGDLAEPAAPRRFRERLATFLELPPGDVGPCLGTSQGLWLACTVGLGPGDAVLVETPTYEPLLRVPAGRGARVFRFPRGENPLDVSDVADRARDVGARLVMLSSPHNPSGAVIPDETLAALGEACARHGAAVLVDEVYRPFLAPPGQPWGSARRAGAHVWATGSLTKRFGLGFGRAGWLAAPPAVLESARVAMQHGVGQPGTVFAALGLAALERLPDLAEATLPERRIDDGRAAVDAFVAAHPALSWTPPPAGPYGWVRHAGGRDLQPAIESLAERRDVLVAPGGFFGQPSAFRIGWTAPAPVLLAGLDALAELADETAGQK